MASVLRMPGVSADATEAALMEWAVAPGTSVKRGDVVATVETEKAVVDLEAEEDGVLLRTLAEAGQSVPIGDPIALLVQPGEDTSDEGALMASLGLGPQASGPLSPEDEERSQDALVPGAQAPIEHTADAVAQGSPNGAGRQRLFASPLARRLAAEAGIPLESLTGPGPQGRIRRCDVEAALGAGNGVPAAAASPQQQAAPAAAPRPAAPAPAAAAAAAPAAPAPPAAPAAAPAAAAAGAARGPSAAEYTDIPHSKMRRAIAGALTRSKQNVPHFYVKATCRVDALLDLRARVNAATTVRVSINDFVVKAAGLAMVAVPDMNVAWGEDAVHRFSSADIGVAMATERGLMTPVVRSVQSRSLSDLSAGIKDLAARATAGTLKQHELEGGSLAVSNLGMYDVEEFTAIINPPHAGILAVGAVTPQPVVGADGQVGVARCMTVVLSVDHRSVDGALAAQWLQQLKRLLEDPLGLLV